MADGDYITLNAHTKYITETVSDFVSVYTLVSEFGCISGCILPFILVNIILYNRRLLNM